MCQKGLFKAIKYFGSQQMLAKVMGVTQQTVSHWLNREQKIPDFYSLDLFVRTKGSIPLDELAQAPQQLYKLLENATFFLEFPSISIPIKDIKMKDATCPKYTDENDFVAEDDPFLSCPILIDANHNLISCVCRLRSHLLRGHKEIFAHEVNLSDVIHGKTQLTPLIQKFPISEKVAIGLSIERELGNRHGKRTDLELVAVHPQVKLGTKTREIAASLSGFTSVFLYRHAKKIIKQGSPILIHAMDQKLLSITEVERISSLTKQQQSDALKKIMSSWKSTLMM